MASRLDSTKVATGGVAKPDEVDQTVLLVGKTGNGKSTVGNVLAGTHNHSPPSEAFVEGEFGTAQTKEAYMYVANISGRKYRIVDTIGLCDTEKSAEDVLLELARTICYLRNGINQIFFVTSEKFTKEERDAYAALRDVLFNGNMGQYVTIVKTKSPFFEDIDECYKDIRETEESNPDTRFIYKSVAKIIHVDNPNKWDNADWIERRDRSNIKLATRLEACGTDLYKPDELNNIISRIEAHVQDVGMLKDKLAKQMNEKVRNKDEIELLEKQLKEAKRDTVKQLLIAASSAALTAIPFVAEVRVFGQLVPPVFGKMFSVLKTIRGLS